MTDSLESLRPVVPAVPTESPLVAEGAPPDPRELLAGSAEPSVRELLVELAHLEDVVRAAGSTVDDPEVLAALAREQVIVEELRRIA